MSERLTTLPRLTLGLGNVKLANFLTNMLPHLTSSRKTTSGLSHNQQASKRPHFWAACKIWWKSVKNCGRSRSTTDLLTNTQTDGKTDYLVYPVYWIDKNFVWNGTVGVQTSDWRGGGVSPPAAPLWTALFAHQYSIYWCCSSLLWPPYEIGRPVYFCPVISIFFFLA